MSTSFWIVILSHCLDQSLSAWSFSGTGGSIGEIQYSVDIQDTITYIDIGYDGTSNWFSVGFGGLTMTNVYAFVFGYETQSDTVPTTMDFWLTGQHQGTQQKECGGSTCSNLVSHSFANGRTDIRVSIPHNTGYQYTFNFGDALSPNYQLDLILATGQQNSLVYPGSTGHCLQCWSTDSHINSIKTDTETKTLPKTQIGIGSGIYLELTLTKSDSTMDWTMYGPSNTWFSIGWGSHSNGDCLIYCDDGSALDVYDYHLGGTSVATVVKDSQNWNIISNSVINNERVISGTRSFNSGDSSDLVFDMTVNTMIFRSCVGSTGGKPGAQYELKKHANRWTQTVTFEGGGITAPPTRAPTTAVPSRSPSARPTQYIPPDVTVKMIAKTTIGAGVAIQMKKYQINGIFEVELYGPIGVWFGVAFGSHFGGDALIYTTGTDGLDTPGESADWIMNGQQPTDVIKDVSQNWNVTSVSQINGQQQMIARRAFDTGDIGDGVIDYAANSMAILVASCDSNYPSLQVSYHGIYNRKEVIIDFGAGEDITSAPTTPPTSAAPSTAPSARPTQYIPPDITMRSFPFTEISGSGIFIAINISKTDETCTVELHGPIGKWFGVGFGNHNDASALIYTTGYGGLDNAGEEPDWTLKGKVDNRITKDAQQDWIVTDTSQINGLQKIVAYRAFDTGDTNDGIIDYNVNTMDIMVSFSDTNTLQFGYHGKGNSYQGIIDFESGTSATTTTTSTTVRPTHDIPQNVTIKTFTLQELGYDSTILVGINMYKTEGIFEVELHGPIGKWFGIAFDSHFDGDALIYTSNYGGIETPGIEADWSLKGQVEDMIKKDTQQDWNMTQLAQIDGKQTIVAHRLFDTGDTENDYIIDYTANTMHLLVAHADSNTLQFANHAGYRWSVTIDFESGGTSSSVTTTAVATTDDDQGENVDERIFDLTEIEDVSSGKSGIFVGVTMIKSSSIYELTLHGPANKWFGVVWEDHYAGDAFIWLNDGEPDYKASGKEEEHMIKDTLQSWSIIENVEEDGMRKVIATRSLDSADREHDYPFDFNKKHQNLLIAHSVDDSFDFPKYHGMNTWIIKLDFESGELIQIETVINAFNTLNHSIFMLIGFAFLIPLGILLVRFKWIFSRCIAVYWIIPMSRCCFVLGTIAVLIGFVEQISNVNASTHSFSYHSYGGFAVIIIWMICMVIYYIWYRNKHIDESLLFSLIVSVCIYCIAFAQIISGIVFYKSPTIYLYAFIGYAAIYVTLYWILEIYRAVKKDKLLLEQKNSQQMILMRILQKDRIELQSHSALK